MKFYDIVYRFKQIFIDKISIRIDAVYRTQKDRYIKYRYVSPRTGLKLHATKKGLKKSLHGWGFPRGNVTLIIFAIFFANYRRVKIYS